MNMPYVIATTKINKHSASLTSHMEAIIKLSLALQNTKNNVCHRSSSSSSQANGLL